MFTEKPTFQHYKENVWLKIFAPTKKDYMQMVNVCIRLDDGTFVPVGLVYFYEDKYYTKNNDSLGTIEDTSFFEYVGKMTGLYNIKPKTDNAKSSNSVPALSIEELCEEYKRTQSIRKTAKKAGISEEKTKKILIAEKVYTSEKYIQIKTLLEQGKSFDDISKELQISHKQLRVFMPK
jgi:hypothetical protein